MIRAANPKDSKEIVEIYNHYVETSIVTFETELVSGDEMGDRIRALAQTHPWVVYEQDGQIQGYAYASPWKNRNAYKHSVEVSVYVRPGSQGHGIGSMLMRELLDRIEEIDVHCLIAGVALPNAGSVALHEKFGFNNIGQFKEVGRKFNKWVDVGYWQLII